MFIIKGLVSKNLSVVILLKFTFLVFARFVYDTFEDSTNFNLHKNGFNFCF